MWSFQISATTSFLTEFECPFLIVAILSTAPCEVCNAENKICHRRQDKDYCECKDEQTNCSGKH